MNKNKDQDSVALIIALLDVISCVETLSNFFKGNIHLMTIFGVVGILLTLYLFVTKQVLIIKNIIGKSVFNRRSMKFLVILSIIYVFLFSLFFLNMDIFGISSSSILVICNSVQIVYACTFLAIANGAPEVVVRISALPSLTCIIFIVEMIIYFAFDEYIKGFDKFGFPVMGFFLIFALPLFVSIKIGLHISEKYSSFNDPNEFSCYFIDNNKIYHKGFCNACNPAECEMVKFTDPILKHFTSCNICFANNKTKQ